MAHAIVAKPRIRQTMDGKGRRSAEWDRSQLPSVFLHLLPKEIMYVLCNAKNRSRTPGCVQKAHAADMAQEALGSRRQPKWSWHNTNTVQNTHNRPANRSNMPNAVIETPHDVAGNC
jgi:hypothetical protein